MNEIRLIDANELYEQFKDNKSDTEEERNFNRLARFLIRHSETIDPESCRPHGRWLNDYCTNCSYGVESWNNTPYCPSCGASMNHSQY